MPKLDTESRKVAMSNLRSELEKVIGGSPCGLTVEEINDCWRLAKNYWGIKARLGVKYKAA